MKELMTLQYLRFHVVQNVTSIILSLVTIIATSKVLTYLLYFEPNMEEERSSSQHENCQNGPIVIQVHEADHNNEVKAIEEDPEELFNSINLHSITTIHSFQSKSTISIVSNANIQIDELKVIEDSVIDNCIESNLPEPSIVEPLASKEDKNGQKSSDR